MIQYHWNTTCTAISPRNTGEDKGSGKTHEKQKQMKNVKCFIVKRHMNLKKTINAVLDSKGTIIVNSKSNQKEIRTEFKNNYKQIT